MQTDSHDDAVRRFAAACRAADVPAIRATLAAGVVAVFDGGGLVPVPQVPVHGVPEVARLAAALLAERPGADLAVEPVNGRAGLVRRRAGRAVAVVALGTSEGRVADVWIVLNPAKLAGWPRR